MWLLSQSAASVFLARPMPGRPAAHVRRTGLWRAGRQGWRLPRQLRRAALSPEEQRAAFAALGSTLIALSSEEKAMVTQAAVEAFLRSRPSLAGLPVQAAAGAGGELAGSTPPKRRGQPRVRKGSSSANNSAASVPHGNGPAAGKWKQRPGGASSGSSASRAQGGAQDNASGSGEGDGSGSSGQGSDVDLIVAHLISGQFEEGFLASFPTPRLNWAIKVLGARQQLDVAEQLFHWMRLKRVANEHSFVKLCEACEASRAPVRALQAWRNTRRMQAPFDLGALGAAALLKVYRAQGDLAGGLKLLADCEATGVPLNRFAYNIALRMCADSGDFRAALRLLARMRGPGRAAPAGVAPGSSGAAQQQQQQGGEKEPVLGGGPVERDEHTYMAVLGALRSAKAWGRVPGVHRWLREDGVPLSNVLATLLLTCYAGSGSAKAAELVLLELRAAGVEPNRTHWNALIYAHAEARDWKAARASYQRMRAAGVAPDGYTVVALLRGLLYEAAARGEQQQLGQLKQRQWGGASSSGSLENGKGANGEGAAAAEQQQQQQGAPAQQPGKNNAAPAGCCDAEVAWLEGEMRAHGVPTTTRVATALLAYWLGVARGWQPARAPDEVVAEQQAALAAAAEQAGMPGSDQVPQPRQERAQHALARARAVWGRMQAAAAAAAAVAEQGEAESGGGSSGELPPQRGRQRRGRGRVGQQELRPDRRAFNCMMELQLAAGDYAGVLETYGELEGRADVMATGRTYRLAAAAATAEGQPGRARELRALLSSWQLLHSGSSTEEEGGEG